MANVCYLFYTNISFQYLLEKSENQRDVLKFSGGMKVKNWLKIG